MSRTSSRRWRGPLVSLVTVVLVVGLAEGVARLVLWVRPPPLPAGFVKNDVWEHDANVFHEPDEQRLWRTVPGYRDGAVRINRHGFRGPEVPEPRPAGVLRVLLLGDSSIFGFNVLEADCLAHLLGPRLEAILHRQVEVINAGMVGYSSWQGRRLFDAVADRLEADVVVVQFGYNDHHTAARSDADKTTRREPVSSPGWLRRLAVVRLLAPEDRTVGREPVPRVSLSEYRENLRAIRDRARESRARCLFLTVPIRPTISLVDGFVRIEVEEQGRARTLWSRQLDVLLEEFEGPTRDALWRHFMVDGSLDAVVRHPPSVQRILELVRDHPDGPAYHYLHALVLAARGDREGSRNAMLRCAELDQQRRVMESYNDELRRWAEEEDVSLLDLARLWERHQVPARVRFMDVLHPSPLGHRINAAEVARRIADGN